MGRGSGFPKTCFSCITFHGESFRKGSGGGPDGGPEGSGGVRPKKPIYS